MTDHAQDSPAAAERRRWTTPEVRTLQAGSAEAGPNPNIGEGAFARGS